jgi:fructosamine-3-kinase
MAHIKNILSGKLFVFSGSSKVSDGEREILELIAAKENIGEISRCELVSNGENYDSYKVTTKDSQFLIKTSFDDSHKVLEKEINVLEEIRDSAIAPVPIAYGTINYGEDISFSITSFEDLQSAESFGQSIFLFNWEYIVKQIKKVHQKTSPKLNSIEDFIRKKFQTISFQDKPEFAELLEKNSINFQLLNEEIEKTKEEITQSFRPTFGGSSICHGSIKPSNLLLGARDVRIINWQNAFLANSLIDIAESRMAFDFDESFEFNLFNSYNSDNKHSWAEYVETRNFWASVRLLDYVFSYIREVYLFRSMRQDKILEIFSSFCRNYKFFEHIPAFKRRKNEIVGLFSQPMF